MSTVPAKRLAELIACRTVSDPGERDEQEFDRFRQLLADHYPHLQALGPALIGAGSLLYRWPGRSRQRPVVLMAHYDVVPVEPQAWAGDPFAERVEGGAVWGRGALDDKGAVVAIAEAVDQLVADGYVPAHDVYVTFGADEEINGPSADSVVDQLIADGVAPWLVLDEGGAIVTDALPGLRGRFAMIGIVEKGVVNLELVARGSGGHASTPGRNGPTARLARAVVAIEDNPAPVMVSKPLRQMLAAMAPQVRGPLAPALRALFSRSDRATGQAVGQLLGRLGPETAAMVRTTSVVTTMTGSAGRNVLAGEARANVNVRLAIGDTVDAVVARVEKLIRAHDVEIDQLAGGDPPPASPVDGPAWQALLGALADAEPDVAPIPYVQTGATDSRHFARIAQNIYRFSPLQMSRRQRESLHGADEHVAVDALTRGIEFYRLLVTRDW